MVSSLSGGVSRQVRFVVIAGAALAVTSATIVAAGGTAARAAVSYAQPGIAVADGNTVIAVQTSGDGLRFYWNQHGTNNWYGEQVAANGTTFSAPSIIADGNSVIIAAQGANDSMDFYWQVDGTSPWNPEIVAGTRTTHSAPPMALDGNSVIISAEGPSNSLDFYWAVNGSPTWNPEVVAGSGTTRSAPVIAASDNWVTIAAVNGIGLGLVSYMAQDDTATWNVTGNGPLGTFGFYVTAMVPSMVAYGGYDYIAETGLEGDIDAVAAVDDVPDWWWSNRIAPDNTAASSPAFTINGNDINIAYIGGDGNLYFYWSAGSSVDSDLWTKETVDTVGNL